MARGSRFHSLRIQHTVVAAMMATLFVGALGLAYGVTHHRIGQSPTQQLVPRSVPGLRLTMPEALQRAGQIELASGLSADRFVDAGRSTRVLFVVRAVAQQPISGGEVMSNILPALWPQGVADNLATAGARQSIHPSLAVVEWIGTSQRQGEGILTHMAADLTRDGRVHWLLYLSDRVQPGEDPRAVVDQNLGLLRGVLHLAVIEPTS